VEVNLNNMFCKNCGQQVNRGNKFCKSCGTEVTRLTVFNRLGEWIKMNKKGLVITVVILVVIVLIASYSDDSSSNSYNSSPTVSQTYNQNTYTTAASKKSSSQVSQAQIAASVVNILCDDGDTGSGGSGTIMSSDGLILTNAHIIPQDIDENPTVTKCLVTLPDNQGKIKEIYYGKPVIIPYLSSRYDLAFVNIDEEYIGKNGQSYGTYPNAFPGFLDYGCENDNPTLGEQVRVFGYPAISAGGYYLTITDGLVSSLPNDGTIFTSAKIDHGSSGGLAVDKNGCMIGIPSMISGDANESLGVLISNDIVLEFFDKLTALQQLVK